MMCNGDIYTGTFEHDQMNGIGELMLSDGFMIQGYWKNGKKVGNAVKTHPNGKRVNVIFYNDMEYN